MQISFETVGGTQHATLARPRGEPRFAVLVAPALGVRASYYRTLCEAVVDRGAASVAVDLPGQGQSPARASRTLDWGYSTVIEHFSAAIRALHAAVPGVPTYVIGHSIGGQVALMASGNSLPGLAGVVVVASGCPWWRTWDGLEAHRIRLATWTCGALARTLGVFPGDRVGFGGREPRTLIVQWAHAAQTGRYIHGDFDGEAMLTRPGPPVLAIGVEGDGWAPERSVRLPLDRMVRRHTAYECWSGAPHGGDHNRWPSGPGHVVDRLFAFVDR